MCPPTSYQSEEDREQVYVELKRLLDRREVLREKLRILEQRDKLKKKLKTLEEQQELERERERELRKREVRLRARVDDAKMFSHFSLSLCLIAISRLCRDCG